MKYSGTVEVITQTMPQRTYTPVQAKIEASRCLMCADAPCSCDCPSGVDARAFIRKIRFDNPGGAVRLLKRANVLAASCSYICPTDSLCCRVCLAKGLSHSIDISGLQRFVMDWERKGGLIEPSLPQRNGSKVAVIGSGPAGLGCAAELAVRGHVVTVFEKDDLPGGVLRNLIPSFRLPTDVVDFEIEFIKKLGVEFVCNHQEDNPANLLNEGFGAVFLSAGLNKPQGSDLIGSNLNGVYQALDVLKAAKHGEAPDLGRRAVVIGGGDTAIDAASVARKAGSECFVLYRRTQNEMPAYPDEIDHVWDEGVEFYFRVIVRAVVGEDRVKGVRCVRISWHDGISGMSRGYEVEGTEFTIGCDSVVIATGQVPASTFGLRTTPNGFIAVEKDSFMTSERGIFAGGDIAFGGQTAAQAVGQGRQAAVRMDEFVRK